MSGAGAEVSAWLAYSVVAGTLEKMCSVRDLPILDPQKTLIGDGGTVMVQEFRAVPCFGVLSKDNLRRNL
jgi:hypothetical protein